MPVITNPGMRGHFCKHLMSTVQFIRKAKFNKVTPTEDEIVEEIKRMENPDFNIKDLKK